MAYGLWEVSGSFIIPGTREKGTFGPIRVGDVTRQKASEHLAPMLNHQFRRQLRGDHKFSPHFALMNLKWAPVVPAQVKAEAKAG